jgi:hypothetical protein
MEVQDPEGTALTRWLSALRATTADEMLLNMMLRERWRREVKDEFSKYKESVSVAGWQANNATWGSAVYK